MFLGQPKEENASQQHLFLAINAFAWCKHCKELQPLLVGMLCAVSVAELCESYS